MHTNFTPIRNSLTSTEIATYSKFLPKSKPLEPDRVDFSYKKQKKKTLNKEKLIKFGSTVGLLGSIAFYIQKNKISKAVELEPNIIFRSAKTLKEAISYGQEKLKINLYIDFEEKDLDVINWINEGLTNCANRHKGKLRMPNRIKYKTSKNKTSIASVYANTKTILDGLMTFNRSYFEKIDESLRETIKTGLRYEIINEFEGKFQPGNNYFSKQFSELLEKYSTNPKSMSLKEKITLYDSFEEAIRSTKLCSNFKAAYMENASNQLFGNQEISIMGIKLNEAYGLDEATQDMVFSGFLDLVRNKKDISQLICLENVDAFSTIYHEMGHLQDMIPRVAASGKFDSPKDYPDELRKWLDNKVYQKIASIISNYAKTGPGEFIAETYAKMISGNYINSKVMELYTAMGGPMIQ